MSTTLYRVGKQVWIVPPDYVSTALTSAIEKVNRTLATGETEQFTGEEAAAWFIASEADEVKTVE